MTRINNYEELMAERRRTELVIADRKEELHERLEDVKEKVAPLFMLLSVFNIFKKKEPDNTVLKLGSYLTIDLLGQRLLRNSNLFTRLLVPALLKGVSSHFLKKVQKNDHH